MDQELKNKLLLIITSGLFIMIMALNNTQAACCDGSFYAY